MADEKPKRKASAWAMAVSQHMKAGGKFPKKGSADYEAVKKLMGEKAPVASSPPPAKEEKPKAIRKKREPKAVPAKESVVEEKPVEEKPKTVRKKREPKAPKEDIVVGKEVKVEHVIVEKPKRKPRVPKAKEEAPVEEKPKEVTGRNVSVSHVIPLMRLSSNKGAMDFPFNK